MQFDYNYCYCEENVYRFAEKVLALRLQQTSGKEYSTEDLKARKVQLPAEIPQLTSDFLSRIVEPINDVKVMFMSSLQKTDIAKAERINDFQPSQIALCTGPAPSKGAAPRFSFWDYHVVCLVRLDGKDWYVVDFDTKWPLQPTTCVNVGVFKTTETGSAVEKDLVAWPLTQYSIMSFYPRMVPTAANHFNVSMLEALNAKEMKLRIIPSDAYLAHLRTDRSHMVKSMSKGGRPIFHQTPPTYSAIQTPSFVVANEEDSTAAKNSMVVPSSPLVEKPEDLPNGVVKSSLGGENNLVCFINMARSPIGVGDVVTDRDSLRKVME